MQKRMTRCGGDWRQRRLKLKLSFPKKLFRCMRWVFASFTWELGRLFRSEGPRQCGNPAVLVLRRFPSASRLTTAVDESRLRSLGVCPRHIAKRKIKPETSVPRHNG